MTQEEIDYMNDPFVQKAGEAIAPSYFELVFRFKCQPFESVPVYWRKQVRDYYEAHKHELYDYSPATDYFNPILPDEAPADVEKKKNEDNGNE
ncbi:hypothetical protein SELR_pSRC500400 (plasmid) [Selenomonas ruminantium subsp. lactilytica TAM6421]|uniref:Uncharacterized protein n=1 Tax=Selenomonas ruminantium subsp. lactilytica (strain NBRC 103574 / TAM6421) TaxID=927704 RepID=I0GWS7_SELRL|nr:hypothetical protein [Selenomonas ruminantium]BAL85214.1 hypothetical protein SELR_pSRC500400 [Selenomonas ruminantium subsp. lactilytica TAM6421]